MIPFQVVLANLTLIVPVEIQNSVKETLIIA